MESLFPLDEVSESQSLEQSPAQKQATAARRESWNRRQKRHRNRAKQSKSSSGVTSVLKSVTLFDDLAGATELNSPETKPETSWSLELRLFLAALETSTDPSGQVSRATILSEVSRLAKVEGLLLMDAARFLDGALERGAIPQFTRAEWVSIPRDVLKVLLDPGFEASFETTDLEQL